eukprot:TRINITY_DN7877_c0_g1_i3.p1 TRINITY_DN7877_c0_g1~~TRINITY_DN7877_c0_g1_i3.p1  ORF type:complete len:1753 (+),score=385.67 TRINITY_DN7877_c0_g1_i3:642-5261(+)
MPRLTHLALHGNDLGDGGMLRLRPLLANGAHGLQHLDLWACGLGAKAGRVLGDCLRRGRRLREVRLGGNRLSDEGTAALCAGLLQAASSNRGLRTLDLSANLIGDASAASLHAMLQNVHTLRTVNLRDNQLRVEASVALADAAVSAPQMRILNLARNHLTRADCDLVYVAAHPRRRCAVVIAPFGAAEFHNQDTYQPSLSVDELLHRQSGCGSPGRCAGRHAAPSPSPQRRSSEGGFSVSEYEQSPWSDRSHWREDAAGAAPPRFDGPFGAGAEWPPAASPPPHRGAAPGGPSPQHSEPMAVSPPTPDPAAAGLQRLHCSASPPWPPGGGPAGQGPLAAPPMPQDHPRGDPHHSPEEVFHGSVAIADLLPPGVEVAALLAAPPPMPPEPRLVLSPGEGGEEEEEDPSGWRELHAVDSRHGTPRPLLWGASAASSLADGRGSPVTILVADASPPRQETGPVAEGPALDTSGASLTCAESPEGRRSGGTPRAQPPGSWAPAARPSGEGRSAYAAGAAAALAARCTAALRRLYHRRLRHFAERRRRRRAAEPLLAALAVQAERELQRRAQEKLRRWRRPAPSASQTLWAQPPLQSPPSPKARRSRSGSSALPLQTPCAPDGGLLRHPSQASVPFTEPFTAQSPRYPSVGHGSSHSPLTSILPTSESASDAAEWVRARVELPGGACDGSRWARALAALLRLKEGVAGVDIRSVEPHRGGAGDVLVLRLCGPDAAQKTALLVGPDFAGDPKAVERLGLVEVSLLRHCPEYLDRSPLASSPASSPGRPGRGAAAAPAAVPPAPDEGGEAAPPAPAGGGGGLGSGGSDTGHEGESAQQGAAGRDTAPAPGAASRATPLGPEDRSEGGGSAGSHPRRTPPAEAPPAEAPGAPPQAAPAAAEQHASREADGGADSRPRRTPPGEGPPAPPQGARGAGGQHASPDSDGGAGGAAAGDPAAAGPAAEGRRQSADAAPEAAAVARAEPPRPAVPQPAAPLLRLPPTTPGSGPPAAAFAMTGLPRRGGPPGPPAPGEAPARRLVCVSFSSTPVSPVSASDVQDRATAAPLPTAPAPAAAALPSVPAHAPDAGVAAALAAAAAGAAAVQPPALAAPLLRLPPAGAARGALLQPTVFAVRGAPLRPPSSPPRGRAQRRPVHISIEAAGAAAPAAAAPPGPAPRPDTPRSAQGGTPSPVRAALGTAAARVAALASQRLPPQPEEAALEPPQRGGTPPPSPHPQPAGAAMREVAPLTEHERALLSDAAQMMRGKRASMDRGKKARRKQRIMIAPDCVLERGQGRGISGCCVLVEWRRFIVVKQRRRFRRSVPILTAPFLPGLDPYDAVRCEGPALRILDTTSRRQQDCAPDAYVVVRLRDVPEATAATERIRRCIEAFQTLPRASDGSGPGSAGTGSRMMLESRRASAAYDEEARLDPTDMRPYTFGDFVRYYGPAAEAKWAAAIPTAAPQPTGLATPGTRTPASQGLQAPFMFPTDPAAAAQAAVAPGQQRVFAPEAAAQAPAAQPYQAHELRAQGVRVVEPALLAAGPQRVTAV